VAHPDPGATFTEAWPQSPIILEIHPLATESIGSRDIDLDKPEVGADANKADLQLYVSFGHVAFQFPANVLAATMPSQNVQPSECVTRFDTARLPPDASIDPHTDNLTLCINTSREEAARQGIPWKVVLLHVNFVEADGTVHASLRAWDISQ
jgi:hypothetical protein